MQAIEISAQTDQFGNILLSKPLTLLNRKIRLIILIPENDDIEQEPWRYAINNPAFEFLHEPEENIYSLKDGKQPVP